MVASRVKFFDRFGPWPGIFRSSDLSFQQQCLWIPEKLRTDGISQPDSIRFHREMLPRTEKREREEESSGLSTIYIN